MISCPKQINCLLIDDDIEFHSIFIESIEDINAKYNLVWKAISSFEEGLLLIKNKPIDLVVSDIYSDEMQATKKGVEIADLIQSEKFIPVILISGGSRPEQLVETIFKKFVEKPKPLQLERALKSILDTHIIQTKVQIFSEIEQDACGFLWGFLDKEWASIESTPLKDKEMMYRFLQRRITQFLGRRLHGSSATEEMTVRAPDYYIYPPITGESYSLGQILQHNETKKFFIILTPHCQLVVHEGRTPKSDNILVSKLVDASEICEKNTIKIQNMKRWFQHPTQEGKPRGRFFFLPRFLDMQDLFADLNSLISISFDDIKINFIKKSMLDSPYAEALQSQFLRLYSTVGIPDLNEEDYSHLVAQKTLK